MPRIHQCSSPFSNASVRKERGLLTITEIQTLTGQPYSEVMRGYKSGLLARPALVSKSGFKRLWKLADVEAYMAIPAVDAPLDFYAARAGTFSNELALKFLAQNPPKKPVGSMRALADKHVKPKIPKHHLGTVRTKSDWQ
jgi:hypothetical protein